MLRVLLALFIFVAAAFAACSFTQITEAAPKAGFCSSRWATGLQSPRAMWVVSNGDVLLVESGKGVSALWEVSGVSQKAQIIANTALNHGITVRGNYVYVSSDTTVWRYSYTAGQRTTLSGQTVVVSGLPGGGHGARSVAFDPAGLLYITIGSGSNLDSNADRAGVFRWNISSIPKTWSDRDAFATGTRNENGIRFDASGKLWGVENGMDNLNRPDMGGDIHNENPGEEVNYFPTAGKFYGYPYCFSFYNVAQNASIVRGTQFVVPQFQPTYSDAWCQNPSNVVKPVFQMRAHVAPLDIIFYNGNEWPSSNGDAFVSQHGSWNRVPEVGYRVVRLKMSGGVPVSEEPIFYWGGSGETGSNWHRPVSMAWAKCQGVDCLLVSSDATGTIIAITATPNCQCPISTTTTTTTAATTGIAAATTTSAATTSAATTKAATTSTTGTSSTTGTGGNLDILQYYKGCLVDSANRDIAVQGPSSTAQTNQKCRYYCALRNYTYSGTQNSNECWCDNQVGDQGTEQNADCSSLCTGDPNQKCGGPWRNSAYTTGNRAAVGYLGCYIDTSVRDLSTRVYDGNANTVDSCRQSCKTAGFAYAGMQYSNECWCGNTYGAQGGKVADSECNVACSGDTVLKCGAGWRNSVYTTTLPAGYAYY